MSRLLLPFLLFAMAFGFSGCGTVTYERARLSGLAVENPTLGRGVRYEVPKGYAMLNPYAVVPARPENQKFENYLRGVVALNDKPNQRFAFHESLLYRSDDRYLAIFHIALNLPFTFRTMPPENRAFVLPILATEHRQYFQVPNKNHRSDFLEINGRTVIDHHTFRTDAAKEAGRDWVGTGFTFVGDVTDVVIIFVFSRSHDTEAGQADAKAILDSFRYGPATTPATAP